MEHVTATLLSCKVKSFPIDCGKILHYYGYSLVTYSSLSIRKKEACIKLSEDALIIPDNKTIYYNDEKPETRIRFSLMHELGHIILDTDDEFSANIFSSNILAPRIAIHYSCKNYFDVMNVFDLSEEASNIAFDDYRRWIRYIVTHNQKMSELDAKLYKHFYSSKAKKFVYKINECMLCGRKMYNSFENDCGVCTLPRYSYSRFDELDNQLLIAENNWLYGE